MGRVAPEPLGLPQTPEGRAVWPYLYRTPEDVGERALAVIEWDLSEHPPAPKMAPGQTVVTLTFYPSKVKHRILGFCPARLGMVTSMMGANVARLVGFGVDPVKEGPETYANPSEWVDVGEVCMVDVGGPRAIHANSGGAMAARCGYPSAVGTVNADVLAPQLDAAGNIMPRVHRGGLLHSLSAS